jgi:hypothetical protein
MSEHEDKRGRYRWRTALRQHLPWVLAERIPKGSGDCGDHEWQFVDSDPPRWACAHCVAETIESPWPVGTLVKHRLAGLLTLAAAIAAKDEELEQADLDRLLELTSQSRALAGELGGIRGEVLASEATN